jgi:hypothetical protein
MTKVCGLFLGAAVLAAVGCGTTEKSYMADEPPPLAKADPRTTELDPVRLTAGERVVAAEDISEDNVHESILKLDSGIKHDGRSLSKVGK